MKNGACTSGRRDRQRDARARRPYGQADREVRADVGERNCRRPEFRHVARAADHRDRHRQRQGAAETRRRRHPGSVLRGLEHRGFRPADARRARVPARLSSLDLRSGDVEAKGRVVLRPADAPGPELEYDGDASIAHFDLVDKASKQPFLSWARVDVGGIDYAAAPDHIAIRSIKVQRPVARVIIARDGTLNLATTLGAATPTTPQRARCLEERVDDAAIESRRGAARRRTMRVADLREPISRRRSKLQGRIANISTAPRTVSQIDLRRRHQRYPPVTIKVGRPARLRRTHHLAMQF